jgi:hypothetical protein
MTLAETMNRYPIAFLLILTFCGCAEPPHRTWTYTEQKTYPDGIVVTAVVKAEEWAQDEPPRTTREYSVTFDGKTEAVGAFGGEINRVLWSRGVLILLAYAEFSIRSTDGAWRHVNASATAELQQQGVRFAGPEQPLAAQWKWLEIAGADPEERAIVLRDRKDGSPFCISFDEKGNNLEFKSRQAAIGIGTPLE